MKEKELLDAIESNGNIPRHIAIIMDGNGRWAKSKFLPRVAGHREGINSVRVITEACGELGVEYLTLYTFSKENWARPQAEVSALMKLLVETIRREIEDLMKNNVRLHVIGHMEDLPDAPREALQEGINILKNNTGLNLVLALNYGARAEILDAFLSVCIDIEKGKITIDELNEISFPKYLYTADMPDPDMVIRTSGE